MPHRNFPLSFRQACVTYIHVKVAIGRNQAPSFVLTDVELAMMTARSEKSRNRVQMARCSQIIATLSSTVGDLPPALFGAMTRCGYGEYALELAQLIPKSQYKAEALLGVAGISRKARGRRGPRARADSENEATTELKNYLRPK
jgi:hypothetical protein